MCNFEGGGGWMDGEVDEKEKGRKMDGWMVKWMKKKKKGEGGWMDGEVDEKKKGKRRMDGW